MAGYVIMGIVLLGIMVYYILHKEKEFRPKPKTEWRESSPYYNSMADPFLTDK